MESLNTGAHSGESTTPVLRNLDHELNYRAHVCSLEEADPVSAPLLEDEDIQALAERLPPLQTAGLLHLRMYHYHFSSAGWVLAGGEFSRQLILRPDGSLAVGFRRLHAYGMGFLAILLLLGMVAALVVVPQAIGFSSIVEPLLKAMVACATIVGIGGITFFIGLGLDRLLLPPAPVDWHDGLGGYSREQVSRILAQRVDEGLDALEARQSRAAMPVHERALQRLRALDQTLLEPPSNRT